jgi:TetR/AcrR family tetracycline transcriptional repressor
MGVTKASKRGPRRASTPGEVLDAALALLDEAGLEAASIRNIAARVGVAPNAIYTYFPDKASIHKAIVERLLGSVDHGVFADREVAWHARVESLALELRARLTAHPGAVPLLISNPLDGPRALGLNERLLELFADAGLDATEAARASYLLTVYLVGSITLEVADTRDPGPLPPESDRIDRREKAFAQTPLEQFPRTAGAAASMASHISTDQFVWGLRRLLDGITGPSRGAGSHSS